MSPESKWRSSGSSTSFLAELLGRRSGKDAASVGIFLGVALSPGTRRFCGRVLWIVRSWESWFHRWCVVRHADSFLLGCVTMGARRRSSEVPTSAWASGFLHSGS